MARLFTGDRLVIASHNQGKVEEISELLAPFAIDTVSAGTLGIPEDRRQLRSQCGVEGEGRGRGERDAGARR